MTCVNVVLRFCPLGRTAGSNHLHSLFVSWNEDHVSPLLSVGRTGEAGAVECGASDRRQRWRIPQPGTTDRTTNDDDAVM
jgi:hypothetical protein